MEELIKEINALNYSVSLRQYNKLKVAGEALWEGCATHISRDNVPNTYIYMDEITFGRDPAHVLGKLRDKCKNAAADSIAKAKAAKIKKYDPFDDDAEATDTGDAFE